MNWQYWKINWMDFGLIKLYYVEKLFDCTLI